MYDVFELKSERRKHAINDAKKMSEREYRYTKMTERRLEKKEERERNKPINLFNYNYETKFTQTEHRILKNKHI